jgi:hypothetical protein
LLSPPNSKFKVPSDGELIPIVFGGFTKDLDEFRIGGVHMSHE